MATLRVNAALPGFLPSAELSRGFVSRLAVVLLAPPHACLTQTERAWAYIRSSTVPAGVVHVPVVVNAPSTGSDFTRNGTLRRALCLLVCAVIAAKALAVSRVLRVLFAALKTCVVVLCPAPRSLLRPEHVLVVADVGARFDDSKILDPVVIFDAVDVMNVLVRPKLSFEMALHHPAMFRNPAARVKLLAGETHVPAVCDLPTQCTAENITIQPALDGAADKARA